MPRPLRITVPNLIFHILNRGNNRQRIFLDEKDFDYFIDLLKRFKKEIPFNLYHFCLMAKKGVRMAKKGVRNLFGYKIIKIRPAFVPLSGTTARRGRSLWTKKKKTEELIRE